jgi:hypothetical protein
MLKSFVDFNVEGDMFIGDERNNDKGIEKPLQLQKSQISGQKTGSSHFFYYYQLSQDSFLNQWLADNLDIIPEHFGGKGKPCSCTKNPNSRFDRDHKKGCHYSWWNRNASRWFRKIACLNYIINGPQKKLFLNKYTHLIWIDSDCVFTRATPKVEILPKAFNSGEADIFYMLGKKRWVIETGIFGIKLNSAGQHFINKIIEAYVTKEFRKWRRWDDGYVFDKVRKQLESSQQLKGFDVSQHSNNNDVADESVLSRFITHFKGRHGRIMNIMK